MTEKNSMFDVIVIGAGPSGAVAAALLTQKGYRVLVLEKMHFPRFSIGESLLPQSMAFLQQANMLEAVQAGNFQFKNGAAFSASEYYETFDFTEKFTAGWGTTFQVQRAKFDKILADEAARFGADVRYGQTVTDFLYQDGIAQVTFMDEQQQQLTAQARFVLDGSGYGRVLARLLALDKPADFVPRATVFTHVTDHIVDVAYDRHKILISVHPQHQDVWFWLIPFSDGRASIGVVAEQAFIDQLDGSHSDKLQQLIAQTPFLATLLKEAEFDTPVNRLSGYACDVEQLVGPGYALLGNAGEFLDPIFSSGVTIALKSAALAAEAVDNMLQDRPVDWQSEFVVPLQQGVNTFREFVESWYDGSLQQVIFAQEKPEQIKRMISAILAGYVWDTENPYVKDVSRLKALAAICQN